MGDAILVQFSKLVNAQMSPQDIFGRVGGDEFVVLLAGQPSFEETVARVTAFWSDIDRFSLPSAPEAKISLSTGACVSPIYGQSYQVLFEKADKVLLDVKASGKGRVCFYEEMQEQMLV